MKKKICCRFSFNYANILPQQYEQYGSLYFPLYETWNAVEKQMGT